jgi:hypothetical protein
VSLGSRRDDGVVADEQPAIGVEAERRDAAEAELVVLDEPVSESTALMTSPVPDSELVPA